MRRPTLHEYVYLCPETAVARQREAKRAAAVADAEYERRMAKIQEFCEDQVPEPDIRPVHEFTEPLMGGLMRAYHVGELAEGAAHNGPPTDELIIANGGMATVDTDTEDRICLTVHVYRDEPPADLEDWDRVVEVGFDSSDGKTRITQMNTPTGSPALTVAGPGHYRLRVHVTGRDDADSWPLPAQHHLLVVFPGDSEEREVLKGPGS